MCKADSWYNNLQNPTLSDGDLNGDGIVNLADLNILPKQWGLRLTVVG